MVLRACCASSLLALAAIPNFHAQAAAADGAGARAPAGSNHFEADPFMPHAA
jgi:hypothetical protein